MQQNNSFVIDYKLTLIGAVSVLALGGVTAITVLTFQGADLAKIGVITAFLAPTIVSLLTLVRSESNAKDLGNANNKLLGVMQDVDGHLSEHTALTTLALSALKEKDPPVEEGAIQAAEILAKEISVDPTTKSSTE